VSRSVFNPPAPLWGEGVLDNVQTLVLWTTNKVVRRSRQCRPWHPKMELNAKTALSIFLPETLQHGVIFERDL
jgi:hypothetical protein